MKQVTAHLNEYEFKLFKKEAEKRKMTEYALTKEVITTFLNKTYPWIPKQPMGICFFYLFICYTLIVTTIVLIFL